MVKRRKMLIGLGALAAGSAAGVGTGAVSSQKSSRTIDAAVVNDTNGEVQFHVDSPSLENSEYAYIENGEEGDGQLHLRFDGTANSGDGLNPNSTFDFDNVFQIKNATQDQLRLSWDKSGLDHPNAFTFYGQQTNGDLIGTRSSDFTGGISSGFGVNIGVRIETPNYVPTGQWETGSIAITAFDNSDVNQPE